MKTEVVFSILIENKYKPMHLHVSEAHHVFSTCRFEMRIRPKPATKVICHMS